MPDSQLLLGIDLGTSSIKSLLFDPAGQILAGSSVELTVNTPQPGWVEQDPRQWVLVAVEAIRRVMTEVRISGKDVAAIGFSGQMHGTVCLDSRGQVLRPAIIWADQRSLRQVQTLEQRLTIEQIGRWTGNPLATGFMLPTWMWIREEEPDIARRTDRLLLPKDYLRFRFSGVAGSEPSDASSTSLFDISSRSWSQPLLNTLDINPDLLPPISPSTAIAGELTTEIAHHCGLKPGTPLAYGGGDQACQALGHGIIEPGVISCTIGTGGQIFAPVSKPTPDPKLRLHLFCHALPDHWHLLAATLSAGLSLRWLRDQVLQGESYQNLADLASQAPAGAEGLFFLPYLAGERTPLMDPNARGSFIGLTTRHSQAHLIRAVMEGVVFALRQGLDLIYELGAPVERIIASGGGARHHLWLQLQANIFNQPIYHAQEVEAAALGAAFLAGTGVGIYRDLPQACQQAFVTSQDAIILPQFDLVGSYQELYEKFCKIYPRLLRATIPLI